ncbi:hypothetical protein PS723_02725 [Pseudomonas fluorescens]|uniref:Uncharacterized protein n=1 Tax=Pseudomonas fluorescens TaxID=294 RepID=A0A5E7CD29_PSEFL|nr:hypothetical protein PS723_02725 [Pseudomonas fluorescens]
MGRDVHDAQIVQDQALQATKALICDAALVAAFSEMLAGQISAVECGRNA